MGIKILHRLPPFLLGPVLALSAWTGPSLFALDPDAAWTAAQAMAREARDWKPSGLSMTIVELDSSAREKSREEGSYGLSYGPGDAVQSIPLKVVKDGKDVTAERRKQAESAKGRKGPPGGGKGFGGPGMGMPEPLLPAEGAALERGAAVQGIREWRPVWIYPFTYKAKDGLKWVGELALDRDSGRPVSMRFSVGSGFPGLKEFSAASRYDLEARPGLVASVEMELDAQILLARKRFTFSMAFSGYEERPGAPAAGP